MNTYIVKHRQTGRRPDLELELKAARYLIDNGAYHFYCGGEKIASIPVGDTIILKREELE